jgi:hypothetical protein
MSDITEGNIWTHIIFPYLTFPDFYSISQTCKSLQNHLLNNTEFSYCNQVITLINTISSSNVDNTTILHIKELGANRLSEFVNTLYARVLTGTRQDIQKCAVLCNVIMNNPDSIVGFEQCLTTRISEIYTLKVDTSDSLMQSQTRTKHFQNMIFIGELFLQKVYTKEQMILLLNELMFDYGIPPEEFALERVCILLQVVESAMDATDARVQTFYTFLERYTNDLDYSDHVRKLTIDVVNLRQIQVQLE